MIKKLSIFTRGSISILVLVFGVVFSVAIGGLVLVAATQYTSSVRIETFEKALTIAQSGAEYYRWHLAHDPKDYKDGTSSAAPYIHTLSDPYGNTEGTYSLTITPPATGSSIITINSQGWLNSHPDIKRTVIAKYAFLTNANVWYGSKITVHGKVFSNGGIRMDGTNDSTVQSAKATYTCGTETGCNPSQTKNGVWGEGGPQNLWDFPVTAVDFNSIVVDFTTMKTAAQTSGVYLTASGVYGYHLKFNTDGTYTIYKVTTATNQKGWSVENGCENLYQKITAETLVGTYSIVNKPIVFVEDHVWVEGVVNGKITVVAAKFPIDLNSMNIWIPNNLTYQAQDGSSALGLIAQNNIIFGLSVPQIFEVDGALLAQNGRVIRHNYKVRGCNMSNEAVKQQLILYGALISNQKSYWNFGQGNSGFGSDPVSGFSQRTVTYDPNLYYNPPPYFPDQGEYEFISWEEQ